MQPEMDRVMEFYKTVRVDGLIKREETPRTMTEYYQGRPDFLSYRLVNFGPRVKKITLNSVESNPRPMLVSAYWAPGDRVPASSGRLVTQDADSPTLEQRLSRTTFPIGALSH